MTKITTMAEVLERAKRRELIEFAKEGGPPKSAPEGNCSLPSGESDPSVTPDCAGADTADELAVGG